MARKSTIPKPQRMLIGMVVQGMKRRSMNQSELAKLTGMSTPYISQLLSGARPGNWERWEQLLEVVHSDYFGLGLFEPVTRPHNRVLKREPRKAPDPWKAPGAGPSAPVEDGPPASPPVPAPETSRPEPQQVSVEADPFPEVTEEAFANDEPLDDHSPARSLPPASQRFATDF